MEITKDIQDDILILKVDGDFDTIEVDNFNAEITAATDAGFVRVLLDLGGMPFINSTALGAMLTAQKRTSQFGGGVAVANALPGVAKTMVVLGLVQKISLHDTMEKALAHLQNLTPESVSTTGEEVEFFRPGAEEVFGDRPRRGRMEEMHEDGLAYSFENLDEVDVDEVFSPGSPVKLRFLLPLYHPSHVFEAGCSVRATEEVGRNTLLVHVDFVILSDAEREAVKQYVKDLKFLKGED